MHRTKARAVLGYPSTIGLVVNLCSESGVAGLSVTCQPWPGQLPQLYLLRQGQEGPKQGW